MHKIDCTDSLPISDVMLFDKSISIYGLRLMFRSIFNCTESILVIYIA